MSDTADRIVRGGTVALRPVQIAAGSVLAALGLAAVLWACWLLFRPTPSEVLQASISARDFKTVQSALAIEPTDAATDAAWKVKALLRVQDHADALTLAEQAVQRWPNDPHLARLHILSLEGAGRTAAALAGASALWHPGGSVEDARVLIRIAAVAGQTDVQKAALLDLQARGSATVAERATLAALEIMPAVAPATSASTAATLIEGHRQRGETAKALAAFDAAIATPGALAEADIVRIAYELKQPDRIMDAIRAGRIASLPAATAVDLVRLAWAQKRVADIDLIDPVSVSDWRPAEPWIALQLARQRHDKGAALRFAAMLPPADADMAREAILRETGDVAGLRALLAARAAAPGADRRAIANQLIAMGDKSAVTLLARAADRAGPDSKEVRELLYLWGPRPDAAALAWLRQRAASAPDATTRLAWLRHYALRARPDAALATLAAEKDADTTGVLLLRLDMAARADADGVALASVDRLLDGRALSDEALRAVAAAMPRAARPEQRLRLAQAMASRRIAPDPMLRDLAYAAYNARRFEEARGQVQSYLAVRPADPDALMLAGDIAKAQGRTADARAAWEKGLARGAGDRDDVARRVDLLERLGRRDEALTLIGRARAEGTATDALIRKEARLLIDSGRPARARTVLAGAGQ